MEKRTLTTKEQFLDTIRQKLGRPEGAVITNGLASKVIRVYVNDKNITKGREMLEHLQGTKGAKSLNELLHNIINDAKAGTREDRTVLVDIGVEW